MVSLNDIRTQHIAVILVAKQAATDAEYGDVVRIIREHLRDNPGANVDDLAVAIQAAISPLVFKLNKISRFMPANTEVVGSFSTLKAALDSISDSSSSKPYAVIVSPGTYTEDNSAGPIHMKPFVSVRGWGPSEQTRIFAADPTKDLLRFPPGTNESGATGLTLGNITTANKFAIVNDSGNRHIYCRNLRFLDSKGGILVKGAGSLALCWNLEAVASVDFPFEVQSGSELRLFSSTVRSDAASVSALRANGGKLVAVGCEVKSAASGLKVEAGGTATVLGSHFEGCVNSLHLGTGGINTLFALGILLEGSTFDLKSDANPGFSNTLKSAAVSFDPSKIDVDAATFSIVDLVNPRPPFIGPSEPGVYNGTTNTGADVIRYSRVVVSALLKVSGITINAQANRNARVGLYRDSDNSRIAQSNITATGTGVVFIPFTSPVFLTPGTYWFAYVHNSPAQVVILQTDGGYGESQVESGPGGVALPTTRAGTASGSKMLMLGNTIA